MVKIHYQEPNAQWKAELALAELLKTTDTQPVFMCIGSDRHLLDSFGPLVGTMLREKDSRVISVGTLDSPVHARNLVPKIRETRLLYPDKPIVAIDASVGYEDEMGTLRLRPGGLVPGRALAKNLPMVGQYSITGVVEIRMDQTGIRPKHKAGLGMVYDMARLLSESIANWWRFHN
jgi:putative sporulation protein YyaC